MKIIYLSTVCSEASFASLFGFDGNTPGQQAQRYNRLLAEGLSSLAGADTEMLTVPPVRPSFRRFRLTRIPEDREAGLRFHYLPCRNVPVLKNLIHRRNAARFIRKTGKNDPETFLVCDLLVLSASLGALRAARKRGIPSCGIVTDVPRFVSGTRYSPLYARMFAKAVALSDGLCVVTESMLKELGAADKPHCVVEGLVPEKAEASQEKKSGSADHTPAEAPAADYFLYAGCLEKDYGLELLINAFLKAELPDTELWICGSGSYLPDLLSVCEKHPNVVYKGVLPNRRVVELEKNARLLINPRTSAGEFTKFSFPSKNLEYLVSGTPAMFFLLPGIPGEYAPYVVLPAEETEASMADKMREFTAWPPEKQAQFGKNGADFVLTHKNNRIAAGKLLDLLRETAVRIPTKPRHKSGSQNGGSL